ncbi:50S ribosomal protein L22 [bacterium]|nr:50S ribosomal protein L22 [bacterium]
MEARAVARYVRMSPRKARQVVDLVRGKAVEAALSLLHFTPKKAARVVEQTVRSAAANWDTKEGAKGDHEDLFVKEIFVDGGIAFKRVLPMPRGSAGRVRKRFSHITVVVSDGQ